MPSPAEIASAPYRMPNRDNARVPRAPRIRREPGEGSNALIGSAADYPQNGANPKPDVPSDATDANSTRAQRKSRLHLPRLALLDRPPSKLLAVRTGTRKSGQHPFADHGALKLGKDPKHLEHRFARRRGSVEALLVRSEERRVGKGCMSGGAWV